MRTGEQGETDYLLHALKNTSYSMYLSEQPLFVELLRPAVKGILRRQEKMKAGEPV